MGTGGDYSVWLWLITTVGVILFLLGFAFRFSVWLEGKVGQYGSGIGKWQKMDYIFRRCITLLFTGRVWRNLGQFFIDSFIHPRLKAASWLRWFAHILVSGSFISLFLLSILTGFFVDLMPKFFRCETKLGLVMANKDTWWLAGLNEILGVLLLVGLGLVFIRRFLWNDSDTLTNRTDYTLYVFLLAITVTGFFTEAVRLLAQGVPSSQVQMSFFGQALANLVGELGWDWKQFHVYLWFFHIIISSVFIGYFPFSKMFHSVAAPLAIILKISGRTERTSHVPRVALGQEVIPGSGQKIKS